MKTNQKAVIAEQKVILRALEKGFNASKPVVPDRYDLIIDTGEMLLRTQVKYANSKVSSTSSGSIGVGLRCRNYATFKSKQCGTYGEDIDLILVYLPQLDVVVKIPKHCMNQPTVAIRYEPPKNGQRGRLNMLSDLVW